MSRRAAALAEQPIRERNADRYEVMALLEITLGWNPRRHVDPARQAELEASVREKGVLEPLLVRKGDGMYVLVAGYRRFAAAKAAGHDRVPVVVKDIDESEALEIALSENVQRADMNPIDEAEAYKRLQKSEPRFYTVAKIAARVGQPESHVYRRLKLLELEKDLQTAIAEDRLTIGHAELLLQLTPALRKEAADLKGRGVVWTRSPFLDWNEKWTPSREDLQPLAKLREFLRDRSRFDPNAEETRHYQPELATEIDKAAAAAAPDNDGETALDEGEQVVTATVLSLSDDPMCRSRLRAGKSEAVPLTPSRWKEAKAGSCDYVQLGAVVHGGPSRVLTVCPAKGKCKKHWPEPKKAKRRPSTAAAPHQGESYSDRWAREAKERKAAQAIWDVVKPQACALVKKHLEKIKFGVGLVHVLFEGQHDGLALLKEVERDFDIKLTPKTAALVLALGTIQTDCRDAFADTTKPWRFEMKPVDALLAIEKAKTNPKAAKKGGK